MGFNSLTFESAPPDVRKQHLLEAHKLLRSAIVHRNQVTPEINDTGAMDLEAIIRLEEDYGHTGLQGFTQRWGPLVGASPFNLAALTPEAFYSGLYQDGTRLLFSYEEHPEKLFPHVVSQSECLPIGYSYFSPHSIAPAWEKPVRHKKLPAYQTHVARWQYLWLPIGDLYEPEWLFDEVMSGMIAPTAIFVRTDDFFSEEPCLLMPCDHPTFQEAKKAVLESLPEDIVDDPEEWDDSSLTSLVPLPWRQDAYRLVYFNPPTPAK